MSQCGANLGQARGGHAMVLGHLAVKVQAWSTGNCPGRKDCRFGAAWGMMVVMSSVGRYGTGWLFGLLCLHGCLSTPSIPGRSCAEDDPCPSGYFCVDLKCADEPAAAMDVGVADGAMNDRADAGIADVLNVTDAEVSPDADLPDSGDPVAGRCNDAINYPTTGWEARYFVLGTNNELGACIGVEDRMPDDLQFEWGFDPPLPDAVPNFGSMLTARRTFEAGAYTFQLRYDDGVRVYIDGEIQYEDWTQASESNVAFVSKYLTAGPHDLRIEHFDGSGEAFVSGDWTRGCTAIPAAVAGEWTVSYHRMSGGQVIDIDECFGWERIAEDALSADWGTGAPTLVTDAGVDDNWALVARTVSDFGGQMLLSFASDDGLRIRVDGNEVYSRWTDGPFEDAEISSYYIGPRDLVVEKYDRTGPASLIMEVSRVCDVVPDTLGDSAWFVAYYPVIAAPPNFTLDRTICLGAELLTGRTLSWSQVPSIPLNRLSSENWGADYYADRTFGADTPVNFTHDDGMRIYRGAVLEYENWAAPVVDGGQRTFPPGEFRIRVEYFQHRGGAGLSMTWP